MTRGSILPALMSAMPSESNSRFLFLSSAAPSGDSAPPCPSWPNSSGSTGVVLGARRRRAGRRGRPRWCPTRPGGSTGGAARRGQRRPGRRRRRARPRRVPRRPGGGRGRRARRAAGADVDGRLRRARARREVGRAREVLRVLGDVGDGLLGLLRRLASGDSSLAIFSAAASAAVFGFAAAASAAAAAPRGRRFGVPPRPPGARRDGRVSGAPRAPRRRPARRRCRPRRRVDAGDRVGAVGRRRRRPAAAAAGGRRRQAAAEGRSRAG